MKKLTALLLCFCMAFGCFSGCAKEEEEPYVPTGDAILLEGQDPEDLIVEEESPPVTLTYNPEMSMNPLIGYSQNNRVLFSLMYQGLFTVNSNYEAVILAVAHREFLALDLADLHDGTAVIYDIKGILPEDQISGRL